MKTFKDVGIEAAYHSGKFIKNSVGKIKKVTYKGAINIVTDVDKKSEKMIVGMITKSFPGHAILGEEGENRNAGSEYKWIIDPIDGTTNFAHAFPFFSVSIALEYRGEIIFGVVYDPMRDELFTAERGKGAYLNKKRIHVSGVKKLAQSFLTTGFSYGIKDAKDNNVKNFENFLMSSMAVRRPGSAALDLCYTACGRFDGYWEVDLHPWDVAAGLLIVRESKGVITKFDGKMYNHYDKQLLASNSFIHSQMIKVLTTRKPIDVK